MLHNPPNIYIVFHSFSMALVHCSYVYTKSDLHNSIWHYIQYE